MILLVILVNFVNTGNFAKWMGFLLSEFSGCIFEWMGNLKFLFHFLVCKNHLALGGIKRIGWMGALLLWFFGEIMYFQQIKIACAYVSIARLFASFYTRVLKILKSLDYNNSIASIGRVLARFLTNSLEISKISIFNTKRSFTGNYFHCTAQVYRQYRKLTHSFFGPLNLSDKVSGLQSYLLNGWKMFIGWMGSLGVVGTLKQHTQPRSLNLVSVFTGIYCF